MISVGLRLTDKFFPPPVEPIANLPTSSDAKSSSADPKMILDGIDKSTGKAVIKRIVLCRTAAVELLRAESPSRIWVRLLNHITDSTLTFREPFELNKKAKVVKGDYAVAPISERVYRRCRIMETENDNGLIKVFFIDDASIAWVERECIGELQEHYMFYPWQAIQVSMFGVLPAVNDENLVPLWSEETCNKLSEILLGFPTLRVEVVHSTVVYNDYARPQPVKLFGAEGDVEEKDHNSRMLEIKFILEKHLNSQVVTMDLHDAALHELYDVAEDEIIPEEALDIHRGFPKDWKRKEEDLEAELLEKEEELFNKDRLDTKQKEDPDWDPTKNKIEMPTIQELQEQFEFPNPDRVQGEPCIMLAVEGRCTKSPYEWYARPIVKTGKNSREENVAWNSTTEKLKEVDMVDWILYGNDQLTSFAEQLDNYYSNPKNRKPLRGEEIKRFHEAQREVFAVCAVNEDKANYTGEWQRVLIVKCDEFAEVRFLDSGGRDMVLTSSLYRIHKQHCRFPPMCLRFSMHGVSTEVNKGKPDKSWNLRETAYFKMCLREDVPIFIDIKDLAEMIPPPKDPRPHFAKHVLMVKDVSYHDERMTLMDRFTDLEMEGGARRDDNEPVRWPF